ncbi:MAG: hypothetical protein Tsb008_01120 [Rhodothalassiaceae bacterium]
MTGSRGWDLFDMELPSHTGFSDIIDPGTGMRMLFRDREKTFWLFQLVGWAGYALLRIFHGLTIDLGFNYYDTTAVATLTGLVLTSVLRHFYRPLRNRPPAVVVSAAILLCALFALLFSAIEVTAGTWYDPEGLRGIGLFENTMFDAFVLVAWSGLYFGFHYYQQLEAEREATLKASAMAHQAQLAMLRYQLNPHFLFNTLNAISTLVLAREVGLADRMLGRLAAFLRHTLVNQPDQKVTLDQEIHALGLYLDIEKVRFEERLETEFAIEDEVRSALVPSLLLQPLIENAIKYAVAPREEGGRITLSAVARDGRLVIRLEDDGPGLPGIPVPPSDSSSGVGLRNTRARLAEIYGDRHDFRLGSAMPHGLSIQIAIPLEYDRPNRAREAGK